MKIIWHCWQFKKILSGFVDFVLFLTDILSVRLLLLTMYKYSTLKMDASLL